MKKLNENETRFLINLLENSKRRYSGHDVVLEESKLHNVDRYFLQQKLENELSR